MTNHEDVLIIDSWDALSNISRREPVLLVSLRELLPLVGRMRLTCEARVDIAIELTSRGFEFAPKSLLARDGSGEEVFVYGPTSYLGQTLRANKAPSLAGLEQLQKIESRLQVATLPKKISNTFVKRERYHV